MTTTQTSNVAIAAIYAPGKALFGADILDITSKAWDAGINLTGADIRKAWPSSTGQGIWVSGICEDKHYALSGRIDN